MQQRNQVQVTKTQLFSSKTQCKSINALIQSLPSQNKQVDTLSKIKTIKIMYSDKLGSLQGIDRFIGVEVLNLNCNCIKEIHQLSKLASLRQINISSNQICSLQGLQKCLKLQKANFANNRIKSLGQLRKLSENGNNVLSEVDFSNNEIADERQISNLKGFRSLRSVYFQKKNATNSVCTKRKVQYYNSINTNIISICGDSVRVDGKSAFQIMKIMNTLKDPQRAHRDQDEISQNQQNRQSGMNSNYQQNSQSEYQQYFIKRQTGHYPSNMKNTPMSSHNRKRNSAFNAQLQTIIYHKDDIIEELKNKIYDLEITNSQQYKDLIKKQAELERVYGQITQLSKQVQSKQTKLNQSHKRLQQLLASCSQSNKSIDHKNTEIVSLNKTINQLKIENAEYRAVSKNYEKRMSELHQKAFDNAEDRAMRSEQLKRHNKQLYEQNISMATDINSLKQRNRQLTQLLRQWDYKYESKINEIQRICDDEKQQIITELQKKIATQNAEHEDQIAHITNSMESQLKSMEEQYQKVLQQSLNKYKRMKSELQQKKEQQGQIRLIKKELEEKLRDKQMIISSLQNALRGLKRQFESLYNQKQRLKKQLHVNRMQKQDNQKLIKQQLSTLHYERNNLMKINADLKQNNMSLQQEIQRLNDANKQNASNEQKIQDLQTRIITQQHMLEDKNNTIQQLKAELNQARQENENKNIEQRKQLNQLRQKYQRLKQKKQELNQANQLLVEERQRLEAELEETRNDKNDLANVEAQIINFENIIDVQEKQLAEKRTAIESLVKTLEECRDDNVNKGRQLEQWKRQAEKLDIELRRCRDKYDRHQKQLQRKHRMQIQEMEERRRIQIQQMGMKLKKNIQMMTNNMFKV